MIDKSGRILPQGERGEVLVRGYSVMRCYWDSEDQTKTEITPDRWYHSGYVVKVTIFEDGVNNKFHKKPFKNSIAILVLYMRMAL